MKTYLALELLVLGLLLRFVLLNLLCSLTPRVLQLLNPVYQVSLSLPEYHSHIISSHQAYKAAKQADMVAG